MGNLYPNLALYLKFKCVCLTFYLFLLFASADLLVLVLGVGCHGRRRLTETLAPCDKETLMNSLWIVSFIRVMHWCSLCMPPYLSLKVGKCQPNKQVLSILRHWAQTLGGELQFLLFLQLFSYWTALKAIQMVDPGKDSSVNRYQNVYFSFFSYNQIIGGKLRFLTSPCVGLDH